MRLPLALATALSVTGCSLLASFDSLTSGSGGEDGGQTQSETDAGTTPPPSPTSTTDAGSGPATDGGCPATALLCDDFERTSVLGPWDRMQGRPATIATGNAARGERSLSLSLGSNDWDSFVRKQFTSSTKRVRMSFSFRLASSANGLEILKVTWGPANNWDTVAFAANVNEGLVASITNFIDSPGPTNTEKRQMLTPDQLYGSTWHRVAFVADMSNPTRTMHVEVDGIVRDLSQMSPHPSPSNPEVAVGVTWQPSDGQVNGLFYDDIVIED